MTRSLSVLLVLYCLAVAGPALGRFAEVSVDRSAPSSPLEDAHTGDPTLRAVAPTVFVPMSSVSRRDVRLSGTPSLPAGHARLLERPPKR